MKTLKLKKVHGNRWAVLMLIIVMTGGLLAACSPASKKAEEDTPRLLRIASVFGDSSYDGYLRTEFTEIYEYTQQVEVEFVYAIDYSEYRYEDGLGDLDPIEELIKLMEGPNPPDLVMIEYPQLQELVNNNMLLALDSYIANDNIDLSEFVPMVIDGLKEVGNDQLYALAPTFSSSALIYNRGLFDRAGVGYPEDHMTWNEIFDLARRVAGGEGEDKVFGFSFNRYAFDDLFYYLQNYTAPLQLRFVDDSGERMLVNSEQWANVLNTLVDLYRDEVLPNRDNITLDYSSPYSHDLFLSGKVAMTLVHYSELDEVINANNYADSIEGYEYIDWDVVTYPTHEEAPGVGAAISMYPLLGINAKAQNTEGAWDFIKFIHSEEWAKLKSRSSHQLVTRKAYNEPKGGLDYNMEAFFALKPQPQFLTDMYRIVPNYWEIMQIGQRKFYEVLENEKTVEEALAEWQTEGDMLLQQNRENLDEEPISVDQIE